MDSGHCNGLVKALQCSNDLVLEEVMFENCGIDDQECNILLEGFKRLSNLHTFVYKVNVFMDLGLSAIKPLLVKPDLHNLLELSLVSCVTAPRIMDSLIEFMVSRRVHLRSLALVKM